MRDTSPFAFPAGSVEKKRLYPGHDWYEIARSSPLNAGMTLRDWFAGSVQADDRLVKCIRAMDDRALELFALHPGIEREEHITEVELTNWGALPSEVAKVTQRLLLEARAIARVRYMQADAMLAEREK